MDAERGRILFDEFIRNFDSASAEKSKVEVDKLTMIFMRMFRNLNYSLEQISTKDSQEIINLGKLKFDVDNKISELSEKLKIPERVDTNVSPVKFRISPAQRKAGERKLKTKGGGKRKRRKSKKRKSKKRKSRKRSKTRRRR